MSITLPPNDPRIRNSAPISPICRAGMSRNDPPIAIDSTPTTDLRIDTTKQNTADQIEKLSKAMLFYRYQLRESRITVRILCGCLAATTGIILFLAWRFM